MAGTLPAWRDSAGMAGMQSHAGTPPACRDTTITAGPLVGTPDCMSYYVVNMLPALYRPAVYWASSGSNVTLCIMYYVCILCIMCIYYVVNMLPVLYRSVGCLLGPVWV